jgi:hypothetical protein
MKKKMKKFSILLFFFLFQLVKFRLEMLAIANIHNFRLLDSFLNHSAISSSNIFRKKFPQPYCKRIGYCNCHQSFLKLPQFKTFKKKKKIKINSFKNYFRFLYLFLSLIMMGARFYKGKKKKNKG